jgi:hypothetical protein
MAETAAHLVDDVFPQVAVRRQWVLSLPRRLRYFLHHEPALIGPVLRIFLDAVKERLKASSPGAPAEARSAAVTFVHRFGSALNANLDFKRIENLTWHAVATRRRNHRLMSKWRHFVPRLRFPAM